MGSIPNRSNYDYRGADLYMALKEKDFEKLRDFLNAHGGLDARDEYGRTALMECCVGRMTDFDASFEHAENHYAKTLVKLGANINLKDKDGYTALYFAVGNNNREMTDFLLEQPNLDLSNLPNILFEVLRPNKMDMELLVKLVQSGNPFPNGDIRIYEHIIGFQTGDIFFPGHSPFDMTKVLQVLHELYPDIVDHVEPFFLESVQYDYSSAEFYTLLKKKNAALLMQFIKEHGGVNGVDEYGRTPLINCMFFYEDRPRGLNIKKVTTTLSTKLIAMHANVHMKDKSGRTALYFAIKNKNAEIVELLQSPLDTQF